MLRCEGLRAVHFRGALAEIPAPAIGARIVGIAGVRFDPKRGDGFSTLRKTERNAPLAPVVSISYNAPRTHVNRGQYFCPACSLPHKDWEGTPKDLKQAQEPLF